jgi:predicted amidophosphoribosyltransferase
MRQTLIGLLMVALTALGLYLIARRRYRCPFCGRFVRWKDVVCPHCGSDMKFRHRAGRDALPKAAAALRPPSRSRRRRS